MRATAEVDLPVAQCPVVSIPIAISIAISSGLTSGFVALTQPPILANTTEPSLRHACDVAVDQRQVSPPPRDMFFECSNIRCQGIHFQRKRSDIAANASQMLQDQVLDVVGHGSGGLGNRKGGTLLRIDRRDCECIAVGG